MTTYGTIPTSSSAGGMGTGGEKKKKMEEYITRAKERIIEKTTTGLSTRRSWKEMFDYHKIGIPSSVSDSIERFKKNVTYFAMNYAIVSLVILFVSLIWHPVSLIVFILMISAWLFLYFLRDDPLVLLNRTIDDRLVMILLSVFTLLFLFLTGATWNIISSVLIAAFVVTLHAVFRQTDDLSFDEETAFYTGIPSSSIS